MTPVSVVIPVYNRAPYIAGAILSVLAQRDAPPMEVIVVDDGSTDDSVARVLAIKDPRVRVVASPFNRGIAAARNLGIGAADFDYVAFLDSDDLALPTRLARQARFLDQNPEHAAVGAWIRWIDADGRTLWRLKRKPVGERLIAAERLFRSGLENSTAMARTSILRAYPHREDLVVGSDYDLWARVAGDYLLATLPRVLVKRRDHVRRATAEHVEHDKSYRCRIFAWQLTEMGIDFSSEDLDRHYRLRRLDKTGERTDGAYLDWAERWLGLLEHANRRHGIYPEPEFSGVLAVLWASACWHAADRRDGWRRFRRARLSRHSVRGVYDAVVNRL